jgi:hypothetical protein
VTSAPPTHDTTKELDVTLAVSSVGLVGDVSVLVVTCELVEPVELVAVTTRMYSVSGTPVKVAVLLITEGLTAVPFTVNV